MSKQKFLLVLLALLKKVKSLDYKDSVPDLIFLNLSFLGIKTCLEE